jgi:TonB family protein
MTSTILGGAMKQRSGVIGGVKLAPEGAITRCLGMWRCLAFLAAAYSCLSQPSFAQSGIVASASTELRIGDQVQIHLDEAEACRESDDFDCARAALRSIPALALTQFEQYRYWISRGYIEFLDGDFPSAIEAYRSAARYSPSQDQRVYHMRSVAQLQASLGQFQEAYDTLEELLVRNYSANPLAGRHLTDDGLWRGLDIYVTGDRALFPLGRNQQVYPAEALSQGLSQGYVDVEFTVTRTGSTRDVTVIESSASVFETAAIQAAEKFRYKPRLVDGEPMEVVVRDRIEFQSGDTR